MTTKVVRNKRAKKEALEEAALELYMEKGVVATSVNEIAERAQVGKGTFYLYFKDKYDLLDEIVSKAGVSFIHRAALETEERKFSDPEEEILYFIDSLIDYLESDKSKLNLIHKNISWSVIEKAIKKHEEVKQIYQMFSQAYEGKKTQDEIDIILFMIIELIGSVSYSSIILKQPADIATVKPLLYNAVRGILRA